MDTLASRLKAARKARGFSQVELAKGVGIKQPTVASLESGRSANSKLLPQIAGFLRVPYAWLLTGAGNMNESSSPNEPLSIRMIPLLSAAQLVSGEDMSQPSAWLPAPASCSAKTFAYAIEGDAMTSTTGQRSYPAGTIVYIDPEDNDNLDGRRVMARVGESVVVRQFRVDLGQSYLAPINATYHSVAVDSDTKIIGAVIGSYLPE